MPFVVAKTYFTVFRCSNPECCNDTTNFESFQFTDEPFKEIGQYYNRSRIESIRFAKFRRDRIFKKIGAGYYCPECARPEGASA